jgi:hypothetical protein
VDAGVVVDLLEEVHPDEDVGVDGEVGPEDVPVSRLVVGLDLPVQLFGHVRNNRVLGHCMEKPLLETFITIFFNVLNLSIRSIFGLRISAFSSSLYSSEYSELSSSSSFPRPINKIIHNHCSQPFLRPIMKRNTPSG